MSDNEQKIKEARELNATEKEQNNNAEQRNIATINRWLPVWFANLRKNATLIDEDFQNFGNRNASIAAPKWFEEEGNGCALVFGSGPSLDLLEEHAEALRNWKGLIVTGSSNATICAGICGRYPDIVMAVDSSEEIWLHLRWAPFGDHDTRLVTNPYINPRALRLFPGAKRYYYKSFIPYQQHPMNWYLTMLFHNLIENFQLQAGCTANAEVLWCTLPTRKKPDGSRELLIKKIFTLGIDFCYPEHPTERYIMGRAAPFRYHPSDGWTRPGAMRPRTRSMYQEKNGKLTDMAMLGYKRSLLAMVRVLRTPTYNCSPYSIVEELPYHNIGEVLNSQGESAVNWDFEHFKQIFKEYIEREGPDIGDGKGSAPVPPEGLTHELEPSRAQEISIAEEEKKVPRGESFFLETEDTEMHGGGTVDKGPMHITGVQSVEDVEGASGDGDIESQGPVNPEEKG